MADRDGRIQKGDRVLSINGKSTKGVTHREALSILKVIYIFTKIMDPTGSSSRHLLVGKITILAYLGFALFDLRFPEISQ